MTLSYLTVTPYDPIIARDSRPFGFGLRMKSLDWPYPSVIAGSLRTVIGKANGGNFDPQMVEKLKAISIASLPCLENTLFVPRPSDIVVHDDGLQRTAYSVRPASLRTGEGCDLPSKELKPAMLPDSVPDEFKPADIAPLWSMEKICEWLTDPDGATFSPPPASKNLGASLSFLNLPEKDPRIHVAIDPKTGVADDGMLFKTIGLDCTRENSSQKLGITLRVEQGNGFDSTLASINTIHSIGGERRLASWKHATMEKEWEAPDRVKKSMERTKGIRMVLATPAVFTGGWRPGWIDEATLTGTPPGAGDLTLKLVSAIVERWRPLSGWSLEKGKRGAKPIKRVVPAGSVYFFEISKGSIQDDCIDKLWLSPMSDDDTHRLDGFGLALWGIWNNSKMEE